MSDDQITIPHHDPEAGATVDMHADEHAPIRSDLVDLIKAHRARHHIAMRDVEERTIDSVTGKPAIGKTWLHKLETGKLVNAPTESQLRSLARGLDLPYDTLARAAAAQYLNLQTEGQRAKVQDIESRDRKVRALVTHIESLTDDERDRLEQLMSIVFPRDTDGS